MRRWRRFAPLNLNGCVCYVPMWAYGADLKALPDRSGGTNHGTFTGNLPQSLPQLGPNLVTNGTFASDTGWTKGTNWAIGSGVATKTTTTASDLEQAVGAVANSIYLLQYEIVTLGTAGTLTPQIGGVNGTGRTAAGWYYDYITATGTGNLKFQADATIGCTMDFVSVRKVNGYQGFGWYWNGTSQVMSFGTGSDVKPAAWTVLGWWAMLSNGTTKNQLFAWSSGSTNPAFTIDRTNNSANLAMGTSNNQFFTAPTGFLHVGNGLWHHVAVTCPGSGQTDVTTAQFFLDGTSWALGASTTTSAQATKVGFYMGNSAISPTMWCGEVMLYNSVLSTELIQQHRYRTRHRYGV